MANEYFYPPIEPFQTGKLKVDSPHELYWEQCGNPDGVPILFLHGGPGAGCSTIDRRFFDPEHFRIVLFDQRGCGRSSAIGDITNNSMQDTSRDIEQLRELLGIETWHVFGGSWGATLALIYAQMHPNHVRHIVLRGVFLMTDAELDWFYNGGAGMFFPDE